jgi:aspartate/methionine/tyrosine aminotransferase
MKVEQFAMERMQSTYEHQVILNLSESGVHPMRLGELAESPAIREALLNEPLRYTQSNGTPELRALIASLYPDATTENVVVTNGGSEANFVGIWNLVEPGDEVVVMVPGYLQTSGLARAFGGVVREWPLQQSDAHDKWRVDLPGLEHLVTERTKLIVLCNPNNPTGIRFRAQDLDAIAGIAESCGAWILSDEIYRGAERDADETPSMWGRASRVLISSGLSKAYGLPGLRIGWLVGPPECIAALWSYRDYTTIAPSALSDALARQVLDPSRRPRILARTRAILNRNFPVVASWLDSHNTVFSYASPDAGAIVYIHYRHPINSSELARRLRDEKSVLIVPGDHFGLDRHLRIGYGGDAADLREGLGRLDDLLAQVAVAPPW